MQFTWMTKPLQDAPQSYPSGNNTCYFNEKLYSQYLVNTWKAMHTKLLSYYELLQSQDRSKRFSIITHQLWMTWKQVKSLHQKWLFNVEAERNRMNTFENKIERAKKRYQKKLKNAKKP